MCVAVGRDHLDDVVAYFQDGDVERTATKVVYGDDLVFLLVETVSERRSGGLIDDALDLQTGDLAGIFGGLTLRVVEIRRYGDDCLSHRLAQVILSRLLQLAKDLGAHLRGSHRLAPHLKPYVAIF